jgi:hypothetical protein
VKKSEIYWSPKPKSTSEEIAEELAKIEREHPGISKKKNPWISMVKKNKKKTA